MSNNKKPTQYMVKTASRDAVSSAVPPRYQPPPQPPSGGGILKHSHPLQHPPIDPHHSQQLPQSNSNIPAKDAPNSNVTKPSIYPTGQPKSNPDPSMVKVPAYPGAEHPKFYPVAQPSMKQYLGYPSAYPVREDIRSQQQHQPRPTRPYEEEIRSQSQEAAIRASAAAQSVSEDFARGLPPQHRRYPVPVDDEFLRPVPVDMLKFVRKSDVAENPRVSVTETNRHMQGLMTELRVLKEANQRLADDNQELRDLCCFLDDDRQKGRKLAREWQRFGRYTASVMRQEVSAYQSKLRELDNKQQELIKDNLELKELCLYLDEERASGSVCPSCGSGTTGGGAGALRDDGDGSSSSTNADEPGHIPNQFNGSGSAATGTGNGAPPRRSASRERLLHENLARQRSTFNDQTMQYVRSLEQRVKQLEEEKRALQQKLKCGGSSDSGTIISSGDNNIGGPTPPVLTGRPEAVVRALQVLEVREQLEREGRSAGGGSLPDRDRVVMTTVPVPVPVDTATTDAPPSPDMDDGEKALVREMCNVVWRKLEEGPQPRR